MKDVDDKGTEVAVASEDKGKQLLEWRPEAGQRGDEGVFQSPNYQAYPKPLASCQDVVANNSLFMETLEKLHSALKTKFMIPIIGGKELDLHRLFVEVTSRGGIEKVIGDRRWKEVTNVFNFPSTATNASFVLRKYYMSLLWHYEQMHFFEAKGWSIPSPVSLSASTPFHPERGSESILPYPEIQTATRKRRRGSGEAALTGPALQTNQAIAGVIDGKFEDGYFVTVMVGATKLKGVLFHVPEQNVVQGPPVFSRMTDYCSARVGRRQRRRKKLSSRDPTHPKPNRSGYNFFFAEQHARLKLIHSGKDRKISRMIGDLWNKLTETEKAVYQERGVKDKERYQSEMAVYKERLRTGQVLSNVLPIQQRPADPSINMQHMDLKMEVDEDDLPSEDDIDTEEEKSDDESELATSPETGGAPTESACMAEDPSAEGDAFELRKRDDDKTGNEQNPHTFSREDA